MDEHERLFRTNYFGAVHGALTAVEHLRHGGGALITVASIAADIPSPIMGAYAASKHAIKGFIHSLRIEILADRIPISVTLIKPSGIDTPIAQHAANHTEGEALVPFPVYDPSLVAAAILDAAVYPRRDVTVGGGGKLQTLLVEHFPKVLDRCGRWLEPMLFDRHKPKTVSDNLKTPHDEGHERSSEQGGRRFSLFTAAARHRAPVALVLGAAMILLFAGKEHRARRGKRPKLRRSLDRAAAEPSEM
jgi:hypothetical protein